MMKIDDIFFYDISFSMFITNVKMTMMEFLVFILNIIR